MEKSDTGSKLAVAAADSFGRVVKGLAKPNLVPYTITLSILVVIIVISVILSIVGAIVTAVELRDEQATKPTIRAGAGLIGSGVTGIIVALIALIGLVVFKAITVNKELNEAVGSSVGTLTKAIGDQVKEKISMSSAKSTVSS